MTNRKLIRSTGIIGSAISCSRVLGFLRDILFAKFFGTNIYAQAFVVAFRIPNMLRDMIGEGATDAAIVPVLTEYRHTRTKEEYWEAAGVILNLMTAILVVVSVIGVVFAPAIVRIIAPGFIRDPQKFAITVFLTRMVFPYVVFLGLLAYAKGVLNSFSYFTTPAFASVLLNLTIILVLVFLYPLIGIKSMVAGVLGGGLLQVLIQIPPMVKRGFRLGYGFRLMHPVAKRVGRLLVPRAMGTAVYQLSVLVDTVLASLAWIVGPGGVAALYYSNRLVQLPLAVFGIALATAALPKMSKEVAKKDIEQLKKTVLFSLRIIFTVMVPAAVGLMVLSRPIVRILFQRGEFSGYSTSITSGALFFYAIGLLAYAGIKIMVSTYYSMGDTRTPVKTAAVSLGVNVVLNLSLMWHLKISGLALATSLAAVCNFVMLYVILGKRVGDIGTGELLRSFARVGVSTVVMAVFIFFAAKRTLYAPGAGTAVSIMYLAGVICGGIAVFFASGAVLGVEEVRRAGREIAGKFRG
ncbi:MAG: murein biosynthesis integral membrane protein MurJ [Candidatus Omnitrophica bacterium]|nr:murein biosynthesis integral membrane protein MurJ [Candidatus Omnitrophota bacterium]